MKAIYQVFFDNLRKGVVRQGELSSLEDGFKQMEGKINGLKQEIEELHEENNELKAVIIRLNLQQNK